MEAPFVAWSQTILFLASHILMVLALLIVLVVLGYLYLSFKLSGNGNNIVIRYTDEEMSFCIRLHCEDENTLIIDDLSAKKTGHGILDMIGNSLLLLVNGNNTDSSKKSHIGYHCNNNYLNMRYLVLFNEAFLSMKDELASSDIRLLKPKIKGKKFIYELPWPLI